MLDTATAQFLIENMAQSLHKLNLQNSRKSLISEEISNTNNHIKTSSYPLGQNKIVFKYYQQAANEKY